MDIIVKVTYRVEDILGINLDTGRDDDVKVAEQIEAQRWEMFQKKFDIHPLELKVEKL